MEDFEIFLLQYFFKVKTQQPPLGNWLNFNIDHPYCIMSEINLCSSNENYEKAFQAINKKAKF